MGRWRTCAIDRVPGTQTSVTGFTAGSEDFNQLMQDRVPVVFAFVFAMAFALLLVTFRSIVIPIKAILLNLVRAAYDRGAPTGEAVAHGIKTTASVVTAAAVVMVAVFSIFATLSAVEFKQFGVGLGVAILIDATIVRGVLLPAFMKLLGDWNWYLPRSLEWLPRLGPGRKPEPEPEPEP